MPLRGGQRPSAKPAPVRQLGKIRRSQLITTYGVGAMVAIGEQSFIVSGLDNWPLDDAPVVQEFRLQTRLGVRKGFRLPPWSDPPAKDGVRVRLFPDFYSCPGRRDGEGCEENLRPWGRFASPAGKNECSSCGQSLTPSRFVVACEDGHLDDFPYFRWVHARTAPGEHEGRHRLTFTTTGRTASLRSILIGCSCGKTASMEGAFGQRAMQDIGYGCKGGRPWLGRDAAVQGCDKAPRVLQRGSSSAWLPVVRSALSIPPFSTQLYADLLPHYTVLKGEEDQAVRRLAAKLDLAPGRYEPDEIVAAVRAYEAYEAGQQPDPTVLGGFEASDELRRQEFEQLCRPCETEEFECSPPDDTHEGLPLGVSQVMLVKRLREVRVLQSFTRVHAATGADDAQRLSKLSLSDVGWLPGIEVIGEGVFISLDGEALTAWSRADHAASPDGRAQLIRSRHQQVLQRRTPVGTAVPTSPVTSRFVLVHTLAHALINEWSLEAGYPAASLRERLFVSDEMAGLLIYTATSDSAGSLGGLVGLGRLRNLKRTLQSALERQAWCSSDPLCMETDAAGVDSLNLAACHSCLLIPETSCEYGNSFLDRAVLVGETKGPTRPYFA